MTDPLEKAAGREAFEKWLKGHPELLYGRSEPQRNGEGYSYGPTEIGWRGWQAALAAVRPILEQQERYKSAIERHLCPSDAADWLGCSCSHEHVCALCSMDNDVIPDEPGCFHEIAKRAKERAESAEQQLAQAREYLRQVRELYLGPNSQLGVEIDVLLASQPAPPQEGK